MKKYSTDYFEKKYKILADKLTQKEGFKEAVQNTRQKLGLPENGFPNAPELALFLINKMSKDQQMSLTFFAFVEAYAQKHKIFITEENREEVINAFLKEHKKPSGTGMLPMVFEIVKNIETHHSLFTKFPLFEDSKYLSELYPATLKLMQKFWGIDLLDDHVIFHYIEKYLFMGQVGIDLYIKSKVSCHNCKYLGVEHFSPRGIDMEGRDEGIYSKNYILNKQAVRRLSNHFNSVFRQLFAGNTQN